MRVAAVGWLATTEAEADDRAAAQAVARSILAMREGVPVSDVRDLVIEVFGYDLRPEVALKDGALDVSATDTVPPALAAVFGSADWEEAVRTAIGLGGDTDTLVCIAAPVRSLFSDDLRAVLDRFDAASPRVTGEGNAT